MMRVINPQIEGIMQWLAVSPDRKYCVSFSNNDQIVICNIISGDVKVLNRYSAANANPPPAPEPKQPAKGNNNQAIANKNNPANKNNAKEKEKEKQVRPKNQINLFEVLET